MPVFAEAVPRVFILLRTRENYYQVGLLGKSALSVLSYQSWVDGE